MTKAEGAVRRQVGALRGADDAARSFGSRVEDRKNKKRVEVGLDKALADLVATVVRLQTHSLPSEPTRTAVAPKKVLKGTKLWPHIRPARSNKGFGTLAKRQMEKKPMFMP